MKYYFFFAAFLGAAGATFLAAGLAVAGVAFLATTFFTTAFLAGAFSDTFAAAVTFFEVALGSAVFRARATVSASSETGALADVLVDDAAFSGETSASTSFI